MKIKDIKFEVEPSVHTSGVAYTVKVRIENQLITVKRFTDVAKIDRDLLTEEALSAFNIANSLQTALNS